MKWFMTQYNFDVANLTACKFVGEHLNLFLGIQESDVGLETGNVQKTMLRADKTRQWIVLLKTENVSYFIYCLKNVSKRIMFNIFFF